LFVGKLLKYLVPPEVELARAICDVNDRWKIFGGNFLRDRELHDLEPGWNDRPCHFSTTSVLELEYFAEGLTRKLK
jgi:hypothetical protein